MKIKLVFLKKETEIYFCVKPEYSDLYICISIDGNNKTRHLLNYLRSSSNFAWISVGVLEGTVTLERWLEVNGKFEEWLIKKIKEFEFLVKYNEIYS